jgi:16S rRNA (guanine527-N7)-methyltransferase
VSREEDRERVAWLPGVSRETLARFDTLVALLDRWQAKTNLVSPESLDRVWTRHIADSWQLLDAAPPESRTFVDLGSGGGFPGLVLGIGLIDRPGAKIHLVESVQRKAAFLREAARALRLPAEIHSERIEALPPNAFGKVDVVTARALAPLPRLLEFAYPLLKQGAIGLFPKGQDLDRELTDSARSWKVEATRLPSVTDRSGTILRVEHIEPIPPHVSRGGSS